ncbi:hypothetical protein [Streptomyces sp. NPDC047070]|uniref:hypothetical protein n=1 Tax=Streptomyces sp. NPDC047070 TaxID=3154923 RepID=UPI0034571FCF
MPEKRQPFPEEQTMQDLTKLDDPAYNAAIRSLLASGGFSAHGAGTRPLDAPGAETINRDSVMRVAYLLTQGVGVISEGGPWQVLGAGTSEIVSGLWDGVPLPRRCHLSGDLRGHVESYATHKIAYRECKQCRSNFTTRRPVRKMARWPELCSTECRKARDAERKRRKG